MLTENSNSKYVHFLDYLTLTIDKHYSNGISFQYLLNEYSRKTQLVFYETEIKEFLSLYTDEYFKQIPNRVDTIVLTDKSKYILKHYGSFINSVNKKKISRFSKLKPSLLRFYTSIRKIPKIVWVLITGTVILLTGINNFFGIRDRIFQKENEPMKSSPIHNEETPNKNDSLKDSLTISKTDSILIK
ncbi:MAG TPA: hypothetical protein DER09_07675 [Prolixibacteraceae bacterium]|nr:hypothetical protein [Prolixibacteraceae bacterium]